MSSGDMYLQKMKIEKPTRTMLMNPKYSLCVAAGHCQFITKFYYYSILLPRGHFHFKRQIYRCKHPPMMSMQHINKPTNQPALLMSEECKPCSSSSSIDVESINESVVAWWSEYLTRLDAAPLARSIIISRVAAFLHSLSNQQYELNKLRKSGFRGIKIHKHI